MTKRPSSVETSSVETSAVVTYVHRRKRPPRKQQAAPLTGPAVVTKRARPSTGTPKTEPAAVTVPSPANDDGRPAPAKPAIVTAASRKQLQQQRAERRALATEGREVSPEVKAFFARMIRPRGALLPEKP
jgi:hypothetical protein